MSDINTSAAGNVIQPRFYHGYKDTINSKQATEPIAIVNPGPICGFNLITYDVDPVTPKSSNTLYLPDSPTTFSIAGFNQNITTGLSDAEIRALKVNLLWDVPKPSQTVLRTLTQSLDSYESYGSVINAVAFPSGRIYICDKVIFRDIPFTFKRSEGYIYFLLAMETATDPKQTITGSIPPVDFLLFEITANNGGFLPFTLLGRHTLGNQDLVGVEDMMMPWSHVRARYLSNTSTAKPYATCIKSTSGTWETKSRTSLVSDLQDTVGTSVIVGWYVSPSSNVSSVDPYTTPFIEDYLLAFKNFGTPEIPNSNQAMLSARTFHYLSLLAPVIPYGNEYPLELKLNLGFRDFMDILSYQQSMSNDELIRSSQYNLGFDGLLGTNSRTKWNKSIYVAPLSTSEAYADYQTRVKNYSTSSGFTNTLFLLDAEVQP
jgi:hypothetical protein